MPLAAALAKFGLDVAQCDSLIATAHKSDATAAYIFPAPDRAQITCAAFLNLFIAWESFVEECMAQLMVGNPTISGAMPVKYVAPLSRSAAVEIVIGINRYFDYANPEYVRKMAGLYFQNGYPFEPHLSASAQDFADMRTMRNASAHITTTTQIVLEKLAQRLLTVPKPGIDLYTLLTAAHPGSPGNTVFATYKAKILVVAQLIANG